MELSWFPAPGKLNLFLHVLGRRESGEYAGYHDLQTVFHFKLFRDKEAALKSKW